MATTTNFRFEQCTFIVKLRDGACFYRDMHHLGGPWSCAATTIQNTSIKRGFRNALKTACDRLWQGIWSKCEKCS